MNIVDAKAMPALPFLQQPRKQLLIDGKWVDAASGKTFETRDPATGRLLANVAEGDAEDVDRAVKAARRAFEGDWAKMLPADRQHLMLKLAELIDKNFDELSALETLDMGAPLLRTRQRRQRVVGLLRYYAGMATAIHGETIPNSLNANYFSYTLKEPIGVVGAIIPWNGPLGASVWKIGPVLATGCTAILKPAEEAPLPSLMLGQLINEAGFPRGVINIITGYGETAGAALSAHRGVDKIAFTGSQQTGQRIVEASVRNLKRVTLELGGKSPDIVFADADIEAAVKGTAMAIFMNSGQICSAGSRLFVEEKIYEEFVSRVADYAKSLKVGNGLMEDTIIGPLVSQQQLDRVSGYLESGASQGAKILSGGKRLSGAGYDQGYFVPPTVFGNVRDEMKIMQEEIFGPVLSATSFSDIDQMLKRANGTSFGLGSGVWTRDLGKAHRMARALQAGSVWINCYQAMDPAVPFGGYKMSGYGRESGIQHVYDYMNIKSVWINAG